jgi:hypothetical protein
MRRLAEVKDLEKIRSVFLPTMGVWGKVDRCRGQLETQEKGGAEKPQALERGGRLPSSYFIIIGS